MTQSYGQANGQWGNETRVWFVFISDAEDDKNENKSEEEFESKTLENIDIWVQASVSKTKWTVSGNITDKDFKRSNTSSSSSALGDDVKDGTNDGNFSSSEKTNSNGRVNVASRNVTDCLNVEKTTRKT